MTIKARSSKYWDKRAIARLAEAEKNSEWHFREIRLLYEEAERDAVESLKRIYESYYRQNKFDMTALEKIVPTAEVEKFYVDMEAAGLPKYLSQRFVGRVQRLEMINAQLWAQTKQLGVLENEIQTKSHVETINGAFGKTIYDMAKGIGATPVFEQLNPRGIEVLLDTPWQGVNYRQGIWKTPKLWRANPNKRSQK